MMQKRQSSAGSTVTVYEYTTTFFKFSTTSSYLSLPTTWSPLYNCDPFLFTPRFQPTGIDSSTFDCGSTTCATSVYIGVDPGCYPPSYADQVLVQDLVVSNANGTTRLRSPSQPTTAAVPQAGVPTVTITDSITATVSLDVTQLYYSPALCPWPAFTSVGHYSGDQGYTVICCTNIYKEGYATGTNGQCYYSDEVPLTTVNGSVTATVTATNASAITFASAVLVAYDNDQYSSLLYAQTALPAEPGPLDDTSVKVALGVAIPLGVLLIGVIAFYLLRSRARKAKARKTKSAVRSPKDKSATAELMGDSKNMAELDPKTGVNEAGGQGRPYEADPMNVRAELDGEWRGWEAFEERRVDEGRAV